MNYNFSEIEAKWQEYWAKNQTFKAENKSDKKKFYVLDMFPYPSGAGLHVGHHLGYIASDIYARYKRHKGFNVLHPMGYDSFGLPAEQYAIQTGQHPALTTETNINRYRQQLDKIGFSFDWSREVRTSDPKYYKWTQWIFIQLFNSWYNKATDKAEDIADLIALFEKEGNGNVNAVCDEDTSLFSASDWKNYADKERQELLLKYRLTSLAETEVNWCPALGTVLANDEIVNGVSERGGHPVIRKKMTQWSMRITAYAQRLLDGLATVDWPQTLKDSQTNWIGRSEGAEVTFKVLPLAPSQGGGTQVNISASQSDLPLTPSQGGGMDSGVPKYVTSDSKIYGVLLERAKEMRKNPTPAEKVLWEGLRKRNLDHRYRRQHPIADYIVDFVCLEKELIVEVDGEVHEYQFKKDAERQLVLEQKKGYTVLRFSNEEVLNDLDKVLSEIALQLNLKTNSPFDGVVKVDFPTSQSDHPLAPSQGGGMDSVVPKYVTSDSKIYGLLLERAKEMRQNPTPAEKVLWEGLRKRNLDHRFRRQHPIAEYIVDFVCLEKELIVEVDGEIHQYQMDKDAAQQLLLEQKKGYTVLRFSNEEVLNDLDKVLSEIALQLNLKTNSPSLGGGWGEVNLIKGISVFTTRPDTIYGVSFMVLAPEHELVPEITTPEQKAEVEAYIEATAKRSERDRMADVKTITGAFTGAYVEHPFTLEPIPVWIGDYVLAGYGTGAVMSVPCGDQRDYDFAKHFNIPIPNIFEGVDISEEAFSDKEKTIIANSDFLDGLKYKDAVKRAILALEDLGQGKGKVNYRLRDAVFSRQRYWGEPFPVYYRDGMPQMIDPKFLPIELPEVEKYLPTETGEPPLGNATIWSWDTKQNKVVSNQNLSPVGEDREGVYPLELNTMPGWAGSSQYFNRYMDPHNEEEIFSKEAMAYWQDVDLYIGGSEHATGHLLYSRFWQKFMFDKGLVPKDEFAKKLINQGMITGTSAFVHKVIFNFDEIREVLFDSSVSNKEEKGYFLNSIVELINGKLLLSRQFATSQNLKSHVLEILKKRNIKVENEILAKCTFSKIPIHVDISLVNHSDELNIEAFKLWRQEDSKSYFVMEDGSIYDPILFPEDKWRGQFIVTREVEKMSKSKYNVVSPDAICEQYGADSLRLYEMFLGPLEQSKPWNTAGITGVHGFLKKLWRLYHSGPENTFYVADSTP